jgi:hypothetical protein
MYQEERSQNRYISRRLGNTLIQPIAMKVYAFVKVSKVIIHASFGGCMFRGLFSARCIDIGGGANHWINGILFLACNEDQWDTIFSMQ